MGRDLPAEVAGAVRGGLTGRSVEGAAVVRVVCCVHESTEPGRVTLGYPDGLAEHEAAGDDVMASGQLAQVHVAATLRDGADVVYVLLDAGALPFGSPGADAFSASR